MGGHEVRGEPGRRCAQHLEQYRRLGLEYALCLVESEDLEDLLRQMRHFAELSAPQFADTG